MVKLFIKNKIKFLITKIKNNKIHFKKCISKNTFSHQLILAIEYYIIYICY